MAGKGLFLVCMRAADAAVRLPQKKTDRIMTRTLTLILMLALALAACAANAWDGVTAEAFPVDAQSTGTRTRPYRITTPAQLAYVARQVAAGERYAKRYFSIEADLDFGGFPFMPIGSLAHPFAGRVDGNHRRISNLRITTDALDDACHVGLFGYVCGASAQLPAQLVNLWLDESCSISVEATGFVHVGAIAGYATRAQISGCIFAGRMRAVCRGGDYNNLYLGGIVGGAAAAVSGCTSSARVSCTSVANAQAGGIAGYASAGLADCTHSGTIVVESPSAMVGGVVGCAQCPVERCVNGGSVTGTTRDRHNFVYAGGVAGECLLDVSQSVNRGTVEARTRSTSVAGGIAGNVGASVTVAECFSHGKVSASGTARAYAGGIAGMTGAKVAISGCVADGRVRASGGIAAGDATVGHAEPDAAPHQP